MKAGRINRRSGGAWCRFKDLGTTAIAGIVCFFAISASAQQGQVTVPPQPIAVPPSAATSQALTEAERERAAAAAREMREFKERISQQSQAPGEATQIRRVTGYRSLEENIKVDRSAPIYTAPRTNSVATSPPPMVIEPKKKDFDLFGGLFGKKEKEIAPPPTSEARASTSYESDIVVVEPLGEAPMPPVDVSENRPASSNRIPPPPGFSEPDEVIADGLAPMPTSSETIDLTAPADPVAVVNPAQTYAPVASAPPPPAVEEKKGLFGGSSRKVGFFGRLFGKKDDDPTVVAAPAPARVIPAPEIPPPPVPGQQGLVADPTLSGQYGAQAADRMPPIPAPGFQPVPAAPVSPPPAYQPPAVAFATPPPSAPMTIPPPPAIETPPSKPAELTAVSAYTGTAPAPSPASPPTPELPPAPVLTTTQPPSLIIPAAPPTTPAPSLIIPAAPPATPAPSLIIPAAPAPAASALSPVVSAPTPVQSSTAATPSSGAHFLVVMEGPGTPLQDSTGKAIQALRPGEVVQFRQKVGTLSLVRLPNGTEGYVSAQSLREASFSEATRFYAAGGSRAE